MREYLLCLMVAAAVTYLATPMVRASALRAGAYTHIRKRDVHTVITPRWGGLGMFIGLLAAFAVAGKLPMMSAVFADMGTVYGLIGAAALLVAIGLIDDRFDLDAPTKFAGQAMAAGILAWQGIGFIWLPLGNATVLDPLTSTLLTLLVVLVCINAVNFVDGLDGLASGIVLVGAAASFVYSYLLSVQYGFERATLSTLISAILTGVCLGFLPHNVNPARIFMGDTGAMMLGLLLASCTVTLTGQVDPNALGDTSRASTVLPLLLPLAALALPLADFGFAVIRRTARGRSPFSPDREHMHHRLLNRGHSPRMAASIMHIGAAILAFSTVALAFIAWPYVLLVCAISLGLLAVVIFRRPGMRKYVRMSKPPVDPLRRVLRVGAPAAITYTLIAMLIGRLWAGSWGSFGALFGGLVPTVFLGITAVTGLWARRLRPDLLGFAILGSWLVKMVALMGFLAWFKQQQWYDRGTFFVTLLVGTFGLLMIEGWLVSRSPQHYTTPAKR